MANPHKPTRPNEQDLANRLALIMLGVHVLGRALITRHDRQDFTVHELAGGMFHGMKDRARTALEEAAEKYARMGSSDKENRVKHLLSTVSP